MNRRRPTIACLVGASLLAVFARDLSGAAPAAAAPTGIPVSIPPAPQLPPVPALKSPLKFFRDLIELPPAEREQQLAARTPQARQVILAKLQEYEALPAGERELRLRTTELSWYLKQLLTVPPPQRGALLTNVSEPDRKLVEARLAYWDSIPGEQQRRLIENETGLKYLSQIPSLPGDTQPQTPEHLERLRRLGPGERGKVMGQFKRLFELDDNDRSSVLDRRTGPDREQLDRALQQLQQIPADKQTAYVDAVSRFAVMSQNERAQFLKSAERWKHFSTEEQAAWRALFTQSPPLPKLPPLPQGLNLSLPPTPPGVALPGRPIQTTNVPAPNRAGA